jgi:hypothetical protein
MRLPAFCFVLLVGAMRVAVPQTPERNADAQPRFDVVSIKRSAAAGPLVNNVVTDRPDGGFTRTNWYTSTLIAEAYPPTSRSDIVGLPDWAKTDGYDIKATSTLSRATRNDRVSMLRAMLAERFTFPRGPGHADRRSSGAANRRLMQSGPS